MKKKVVQAFFLTTCQCISTQPQRNHFWGSTGSLCAHSAHDFSADNARISTFPRASNLWRELMKQIISQSCSMSWNGGRTPSESQSWEKCTRVVLWQMFHTTADQINSLLTVLSFNTVAVSLISDYFFFCCYTCLGISWRTDAQGQSLVLIFLILQKCFKLLQHVLLAGQFPDPFFLSPFLYASPAELILYPLPKPLF